MEHLREEGKTLAWLASNAALPNAALAPRFCTPNAVLGPTPLRNRASMYTAPRV
jgi:hypothetical protein